MAERRKRGLGRGLGALIPDAASSDRPVDVFFSGGEPDEGKQGTEEQKAARAARTDPAASMQSSRRRKPKAGATTTSSTAKTAKKETTSAKPSSAKSTSTSKSSTAKTTPAKSTAANSAAKDTPAKSASTTSTNAKKSASSAKAPTAKGATGAASKRTTTGAKTSASKTSGTKTSGTPAKAANNGSAASTSSEKMSSGVKSSSTKEAASAASSPELDNVRSTSSVETSQAQEYDTSYEAAAPVFETAEPDVEANSSGMTNETVDSETSHPDDEVSETHPGVYRSGHERFDEAREESSGFNTQTTDEVDATSSTLQSVDNSAVNDSATDVSGAADHDSQDSEQVVTESSSDSGIETPGVDSIPDTEFGEIDVDLIDANPRQPRTFFDEDQLSELVHSIREIGVLQPVVVRQKPGDSERFELIMGERRLRATKDAGLSAIPAIIRYVDDTDLLRDALLENLHRAELNPLEEAAAYGQLLEDFGCTQEELSERIGRSRPQISNTLRLLRLPPLVQRRVAAGVISAGHARAILGLREPEHMEILAQRIVAEGLSVRASEEAVVLLNRGDSMNVSRATTKVAPQFIEVAERLGDRLDTKVNITVGKKKGKLSVEFANQDDLDRILLLLGVESPAE
ncbi:MAG: ParB/RepB/Spo0J family partition protein [Brevibacterium aurantiacum]|uniref:ParB/RepB/Spo0J family partition protein n=1 Tax=Brevibacterium aurantiacum TaxID=273384 RepID=UPI000DF2B34D|nr:ParB/RepB/Spo0J family partition protein [Brevibacterium sp.]MDN5711765.1 ParB/RepB/Spo0J family partition protein [Brevibacterium aurantiacum]RCS94394.1 ParB/RepB/Spo0J family partition protein [Brevibacterium aurantiacum]